VVLGGGAVVDSIGGCPYRDSKNEGVVCGLRSWGVGIYDAFGVADEYG